MSDTSSSGELYQLCLWDLAEGACALANLLPSLARCADNGDLRSALEAQVTSARERERSLRDLIDQDDGPDNLWIAGIVEDAERDTRTVERGGLLDVAMIGAVRKALHAEIASLHTARAMAEACDARAEIHIIDRAFASAEDDDATLHGLLGRIAGRLGTRSAAPAAQAG